MAPAPPVVLVCGGAAVDCIVKPFDASQRGASRTSVPGEARLSSGGVGRNICEVVARLGGRPRLLSAVGADEAGDRLLASAAQLGIDTSGVARPTGARTATFTALLDGAGDLVGAIADMAIFDEVSPAAVGAAEAAGVLSGAALAVCDANLPGETLRSVRERCQAQGVPAWLEPVSVAKAPRGAAGAPWHLVSPNWDELQAMLGSADPQPMPAMVASALPEEVPRLLDRAISDGVAHNILLTMGPHGAVLASAAGGPPPQLGSRVFELDAEALLGGGRGLPPLTVSVEVLRSSGGARVWYRLLRPLDRLVDSTGAGDALVAGAACAFAAGWPLERAVLAGLFCAHATLFTEGAVCPALHGGLLVGLQAALGGAVSASRL